ncbi:hypothetical protein Fot_11407 [Forsythia ovata]|uniref:Uncharacterized protein n=1 Tax=Forsythia ovata TaxID=205694 RepID=A0ABD1WJU3_9LAMI
MNFQILARFSPLLLGGIEEELIRLHEDDNEIMKEGVLHILAKGEGTIREQLGVSSRSLDLMLEWICIEGSRRQAKYVVYALALITKDHGLMSLSVLYETSEDKANECWDDRSELCSLKIYGVKALVKSYLPVKDAHLCFGINTLVEMLKNLLSLGEISRDIKSRTLHEDKVPLGTRMDGKVEDSRTGMTKENNKSGLGGKVDTDEKVEYVEK